MDNSAVAAPENVELRRDIDRLRADVRHLRTDLSTFAGDALQTARWRVADARERMQQAARLAASKGQRSLRAAEQGITDHPMVFVGAAFAAGALLGVAIARRK